ncbi:hypothetical protein C3L33_06325, partial [Rhododendron williamsianum]
MRTTSDGDGRYSRRKPGVDRLSKLPDLCSFIFSLSYQSKTRSEPRFCRNGGNPFGLTRRPSFSVNIYDDDPEDERPISYDTDIDEWIDLEDRNFAAFVDKTLLLSNCSKVDKLEFDFEYQPCLASNVDLWTRFAAVKGTEELHLVFHDENYYADKNRCYEVNLKGILVEITEEVVDWRVWNCQLINVSSLVDAKLACKLKSDGGEEDFIRIQNELGGLLSSFAHVKSLAVGTWAMRELSSMEAKGLSSPLLNCTSLTLEAWLDDDVFPWIATMLGLSPNLETLVMTKSSSESYMVCFQSPFNIFLRLFHEMCKSGFDYTFHILCMSAEG